jgi:hypothetical protein
MRIGKEANEIEEIEVGILELEDERLSVYDDGVDHALRRGLLATPTKDIMRATGLSRSMVKAIKNGSRRPSDKARSMLMSVDLALKQERS